jgi:hypothetical protein
MRRTQDLRQWRGSGIILAVIAAALANSAEAAVLPGPWGALSTGSAQASAAGVTEGWVLANSFDHTVGLSEAIMVANEQMNVTTQLVPVGTGIATISFGPGGIFFTGSNLAPGHPFNPAETDFVQIGGNGAGFAVPVVLFRAVPDDSYSVSMTATARTHGGSMTDSHSSTGSPSASTSATAVFGPTPGGSPAEPFTTFSYFASLTVSVNGGPLQSLFSGGFGLDGSGNLNTTGDITPADIAATPTGFAFAAPIDFSMDLTDPVTSFEFNFHSEGDLRTVAVPEPAYIAPLLTTLLGAAVCRMLSRARKGTAGHAFRQA